jgi:type VI secretion system protein ImpG
MSARQRQQGPRSAYLGEEVWISLVDGRHGAWQEPLRQLSVQALVSNRDLPTLLPSAAAGGTTWRLDAAGAVTQVDTLRGPTRPVSRRPVGDAGWALVRQLSLHHLALASEDPARGAAVLRDTLSLYAAPEDVAWARQIEGVRGLATRTVTGRLPFPGPLTFGTGLEMTLELDELAFPGSSAMLFAAALERFLARHAAINTFTRLTLRTLQRGEVRRWPARVGTQELL